MKSELEVALLGCPVMGIFRNKTLEETLELAHQAWDLGIELVEVPIQSVDALAVLEAVVSEGRDRGKLVGAGTVTTPDQLVVSHRLGAAFTVAPGLDRSIVKMSDELGMSHIPGVASPTEIQSALSLGCKWLKAYPASLLTPGWFSAMKNGPFPDVSLMATGGIDASNAESYVKAGASVVAIGSAFGDRSQIEALRRLLARR